MADKERSMNFNVDGMKVSFNQAEGRIQLSLDLSEADLVKVFDIFESPEGAHYAQMLYAVYKQAKENRKRPVRPVSDIGKNKQNKAGDST